MTKITIPTSFKEKAKYGFALFLCTTLLSFIDFISNMLRSLVSNDMDITSWLYYLPAALGHAALFALILYVVLYIPLAFIFKNYKIATIVYITFAILLQILIILDGFVFNLYRFHINGFVLELVLGGGSEIFVFDFWVVIKFILFILLVAVLPYILFAYLSKKTYKRLTCKRNMWISIFLLICLLVSHVGHAWASANKHVSIQKSATVLPFFFPLTANKLLTKMGLVTLDDLDKLEYNVPSANFEYPLKPLEIADSIPNYNIVYIVIDSWNPTTCDSIITPNIYKLAQRGEYFTDHQSSSNGTRGSIFGIFFGVSYTYEKDFIISKTSPLFIDQLMDRNYNIQTFPSADFTMPPFHETIFRRVPHINIKTEGKTPFDRDNKITEMATKYITEQEDNKPFFSFLFYDLPHAISIPKEHRTKFQPSWDEADYMKLSNEMDRTPFFNLYKNCVYHVDSLVGNVMQVLTEKGVMDKTIIVITGDHGQEFNENKKNYWGHNGNFSEWQTRVPLVIYYPGIEGGKVYSHQTTHYDIAPTVMRQFLGIKNPASDYTMGADLLDTTSRYPHIIGDHVNYGFIFENAIVKTNHLGTLEITDKQLNPISRSAFNASQLQKAIEKKNMFYKK